ncbi:hypothetical protein MLD38_029540 [Melastoma candidum]|uniref:Uncharacterized protein n=1 Tax=Melastoma candidum TaxID=119954 RepID=A0ACB9N421_9MYRT|nr:hypothetical protein MLD38_029540 [Melastoma candidum]
MIGYCPDPTTCRLIIKNPDGEIQRMSCGQHEPFLSFLVFVVDLFSSTGRMQGEEQQAATKSALKRAQWLRAAILGANDGLLSTTSLILGIGAAKEDRQSMVLSGIAGAIAGAFSMAVGEFVSVSTQRDIEMSTRKERTTGDCVKEQHNNDNIELGQVMAKDSGKLDSEVMAGNQKGEADGEVVANPYTASAASAFSFLCGAIVPIVPALAVMNNEMRVVAVAVVATVALAVFGGMGAYLGGSSVRVSAMRVLLGGWIAMGITYGLLKTFDRDGDDD